MEFEDILEEVGGYGKFQRNLTLLFLIPVSIVIPWFWMNFIFMVSVPEHWCYVPELATSNLTVTELRMLISPPENPSCSMYNMNYTLFANEDTSVINSSDIIIPCTNGWQYDKQNYESTAATKFNLVCDNGHFPSLLLALQNVGSLIGTPIYGYLSDRYGRKIVFLLLAILVTTTEIASIFVNNFILFTVLRTINGSVLPTMFVLPYLLLLEIVSPKMRAHMNGIINLCWTFGLSLLPLIAYVSRTWVILGLTSSFSGFCILFYWNYIPESPCWLVSQERYEDAADIMMKVANTNGKQQTHTHILMQLQNLGAEIKKKKEEEDNSSTSQILKYPRLRRNFLIISLCWTAFNVAYMGFTYNIINLDGNEFTNFFLLSVVEFPGNLVFWFSMDRFGRRWTAAVGYSLIGLSCILPVIGFTSSDIISSMVGKFLVSGLLMVSDQQGSELFPTVARSFGVGTGKTIAAAISLFMPYIAYLSMYGKSIPFVIIGLTCLFTGMSATFLPETLNENLPQTISDAEEFGKDQKYFSWIRRLSTKKIPTATGIDNPIEVTP